MLPNIFEFVFASSILYDKLNQIIVVSIQQEILTYADVSVWESRSRTNHFYF